MSETFWESALGFGVLVWLACSCSVTEPPSGSDTGARHATRPAVPDGGKTGAQGGKSAVVAEGGTIAQGGQSAETGGEVQGGQAGGTWIAPLSRCHSNADCTDPNYYCYVPAVVARCEDGPTGYCATFNSPHCGLTSSMCDCLVAAVELPQCSPKACSFKNTTPGCISCDPMGDGGAAGSGGTPFNAGAAGAAVENGRAGSSGDAGSAGTTGDAGSAGSAGDVSSAGSVGDAGKGPNSGAAG
jgi:hypothetical protein